MLCAPNGGYPFIVNLTAEDTCNTAVECCAATRAGSSVRYVLKIAFVRIYIAQEQHDIGHQVVIEGDIVLITAFPRQWPILAPTPTSFLCREYHLQSAKKRSAITLIFVIPIDMRQKPHLLGGGIVVETRVFAFLAHEVHHLLLGQFVHLAVLHPSAVGLLHRHHYLCYRPRLVRGVPLLRHLTRAYMPPFLLF